LRATQVTSDPVERVTDELLTDHGIRDYFDRMIYGTAAEHGCTLLTEDEELLKLKRREGPRPKDAVAKANVNVVSSSSGIRW
jgi:PIN domain nuclease of toxin-antitoxin system